MNVGRLRLANQHVTRPVFDDPGDVVRWLGAVQAQDYLGGLWAVGLRTRNATESTVEAAIARRAIIRTWPMRGTLHFVAAEDARWMLGLLTPRVIASAAGRHRQLELDAAVFRRAARVAERALVGNPPLRRDALYELWSAAGIATEGSRGLHILGYLAHTGLLCFGPRAGKQHTITLLEEWVPAARTLARDEALGEIARRYFTSHGPATVQDLAWWSGLTMADARAALEQVKAGLVRELVDGREYWLPSTEVRRASSGPAHLLPAWDEFTVAYRDRDAILDPAHAREVNAGGGILKPVVVVGGQVVGTWQRTLAKGEVVVRPRMFDGRGAVRNPGVAAAVRRYARFLAATAAVA